MAGTFKLCDLPSDIANRIFGHLDHRSVAALRCVNGHFNGDLPLDLSQHSTRINDHLHAIETSKWYRRKCEFACYDCRTLKPKIDFNFAQTRLKRGREGVNDSLRRCLDCSKKRASFAPRNVVKMNDGTLQVFCGGCSTLRLQWCQACLLCRECVEKGRSRCRMRKQKHHEMWNTKHAWRYDNEWEPVVARQLPGGLSRVPRSKVAPMQANTTDNYDQGYGNMVIMEWLNGTDDI